MKKQNWVILLAFLGGVLFANMLGKDLLTNYGILNSYYLDRYTCHEIDCDRLFCYVLMERMKMVAIVVILGRFVGKKHLFCAAESLLAIAFGILITGATMNLGIGGVFIALAALFPQWFFYQITFIGYVQTSLWHIKGVGKEGIAYVVTLFVLGLLFLIGIIAESYLNPWILSKILKFF